MADNGSVLQDGPGAWHDDMAAGENMSDDQARYQTQVTGASADRTYYLNDVSFDGFQKGSDGAPNTLIEAKYLENNGRFARAYDNMNGGNFKDFTYLADRADKILDQARRQVQAAKGTNSRIVWRVSGDRAASAVGQLFAGDKNLRGKITVEHVAREWTEKAEKGEKPGATAERSESGAGTRNPDGAGDAAADTHASAPPDESVLAKAKTLFEDAVMYVVSAGGVNSVAESKANYEQARTDPSLPPQGKATPITDHIVSETPQASGEIWTAVAGAAAKSAGAAKGAPRVRIATERTGAAAGAAKASGNTPRVRVSTETPNASQAGAGSAPKVGIATEPAPEAAKVRVSHEPRVRISTEPKTGVGRSGADALDSVDETPRLQQRQAAPPRGKTPSQTGSSPSKPAPRSDRATEKPRSADPAARSEPPRKKTKP